VIDNCNNNCNVVADNCNDKCDVICVDDDDILEINEVPTTTTSSTVCIELDSQEDDLEIIMPASSSTPKSNAKYIQYMTLMEISHYLSRSSTLNHTSPTQSPIFPKDKEMVGKIKEEQKVQKIDLEDESVRLAIKLMKDEGYGKYYIRFNV
jgi:hypothetical protein